MPIRNKSAAANTGGGLNEPTPVPVVQSTPQPGENLLALDELTHLAGIYLAMHEKVKEYDVEKDTAGSSIKTLLAQHPQLLTQVGAHRETTVMFSGVLEILVRLQAATSVKYADDAIQSLRNKIGGNLDPYIIIREELADGALEALYNGGFITQQDVEELTVVNVRESLIVKEAKPAKAAASTRKPLRK